MKRLMIGLMLLSASVFAKEGGNGEIVVQCGEKVQLAEFHEAAVLPGLKDKMNMIYSDEDVEVQVENAFKRLSLAFPKPESVLEKLFIEYELLKKNLSWIQGDYTWNFTDDLGPFPTARGCKTVNIINYFDDDFIEGQINLFEQLTSTEKAALYVHEVVYKISRRETMQKTSLPARRIVTYLFSDLNNINLLKGLVVKYLLPEQYNLSIKKTEAMKEIYFDLKDFTKKYKGMNSFLTDPTKKVQIEHLRTGRIFKSPTEVYTVLSLNSKLVDTVILVTSFKSVNDLYSKSQLSATMYVRSNNLEVLKKVIPFEYVASPFFRDIHALRIHLIPEMVYSYIKGML